MDEHERGAVALRATSEAIVAGFKELHALIPSMDDLALLATYHQAAHLGKQSWLVAAHVLWEAKRRKLHHNDGGIRAVAEDFGISPSNASAHIRIWEEFREEFLSQRAPFDHLIGVSWYKVAAYSVDPVEALEAAAAKKRADPAYSIRDFEQDLASGRIGGEGRAPSPAVPSATKAAKLTAGDRAAMMPIPMRLDQPAHADASTMTPAQRRQDALVDRYLATVEVLLAGLSDNDDLLFNTDPEALARLLPALSEEEAADQSFLARAFGFLGAVFQARERRRGEGNGPRAAGRAASA